MLWQRKKYALGRLCPLQRPLFRTHGEKIVFSARDGQITRAVDDDVNPANLKPLLQL